MSVLHSADVRINLRDQAIVPESHCDQTGTSAVTLCSWFSIHGNREPSTLSETVSDFIVQRLHQWGVRHIFGYPGDGINGVFGALNRAEARDETRISFVQARHEEMAAFMASAYAKFSGEL